MSSLSPKGTTACIEFLRVFTRSPGIQPGKTVASRAFEVSCSLQSLSRVRARDDVLRRCFLDGRDSHVDVLDWSFLKSVDDRGSHPIPPRLTCRQLLPQAKQFPACLWFGVCSLQRFVAFGQVSVEPEFAARENVRLYTFAAFSWRVGARHELPSCCHYMLRHDAPLPEPTTVSNRCVYSSNRSQSLQASGVIR